MPKIDWPCIKCNQELSSSQELKEHRCGQPKKLGMSPEEKKILAEANKSKPIKLIYKYEGTCECGAGVDTIELETAKKTKVNVICWCNTCRKSIKNSEQKKIE